MEGNYINTKVGLKSLRENKGLTIEEVALKIGVNPRVVSEFEINPSYIEMKNAVLLSGLYNVAMDAVNWH